MAPYIDVDVSISALRSILLAHGVGARGWNPSWLHLFWTSEIPLGGFLGEWSIGDPRRHR